MGRGADSNRHSFLAVDRLPRFRPSYSLAIYEDEEQTPSFVRMGYDGQGVYSVCITVSKRHTGFTTVADGDVRRSLYPEMVCRWPLMVEAVQGPGDLPSNGHA